MNRKELAKKLKEAAEKVGKSKDKFIVDEQLFSGRGVGNYRFTFRAVKKKKSLLGSIAKIAKSAMYYGVSGAISTAAGEFAMSHEPYLEPIHKEMEASELAAILQRWSETIPKGYIETIGNVLLLPKDDKWISANINPKKEIKITMDFVRIKGMEEITEERKEKGEASEALEVMKQVPQPPQVTVGMPPTLPVQAPIPSPSFSNLYVKGSLRNSATGVEFAILNPAPNAKVLAPFKIMIDGKQVKSVKIVSSEGIVDNNSISKTKPLLVKQGETLLIKVDGIKLSKGLHKIDIEAIVENFGKVMISNVDSIEE